jgi:cytochrome c553
MLLSRRKRYALVVATALGSVVPFASAQLAIDPATEAREEFREAARLTPNITRGAQLFQTCAACHGSAGLGRADGNIPAIAGQHNSVVLKQLIDFRDEQRWNAHMQKFTDWHHLPNTQDLTNVAAYVASLPRFPSLAGASGDGANLREGASLYSRACTSCHGRLGQGDPARLSPRLAGQRYGYLLRQMDEGAAGYRPGMGPQHIAMLRALKPEQMRGVADYLSRMSSE